MGSNTSSLSNLKKRFLSEMKADKRKAFLLVALAIIAGAMGGRLLVNHLGPSTVDAAVKAPQAAGLPSPKPAPLAPSLPPAGQKKQLENHLRLVNRNLSRDLFLPNPDFFPAERAEAVQPKPTTEPASRPATEDEAEINRRTILAAAKALTLQSTIISATPTTVINGRVLRVGDWINGFEVKEIAPRACVVQKRGVNVPLTMKRDE